MAIDPVVRCWSAVVMAANWPRSKSDATSYWIGAAKGTICATCESPMGEGKVFQAVYRRFGRGRISDSWLYALARTCTGNGEVKEVREAQCKSVAKV